MDKNILAPAAVLALWTLVMLGWMLATRMSGLARAGIDLRKAAPGGRGNGLEGVLPDSINWKAHNYVHLMEQPTVFYAVVGILALAGGGHALTTWLAWGYAGFRIAHSLWQATVNTIPVRFALFLVSSLCLVGLAVNAVMATCF